MLRFWRNCFAAVSRIHDLGIVHHDIKCDNVLLIKNKNNESALRERGGDDDNDEVPSSFTVRLCDFGEAVITRRRRVVACRDTCSTSKTSTATTITTTEPLLSNTSLRARGTERVQSPEMLAVTTTPRRRRRQRRCDERGQKQQSSSPSFSSVASFPPPSFPTDVWSLGCLLYELITGKYLFDPGSDWSRFYVLLTTATTDDDDDDEAAALPLDENVISIRRVLGDEDDDDDNDDDSGTTTSAIVEFVKRLLQKCLRRMPTERPTARDLQGFVEEFIGDKLS